MQQKFDLLMTKVGALAKVVIIIERERLELLPTTNFLNGNFSVCQLLA